MSSRWKLIESQVSLLPTTYSLAVSVVIMVAVVSITAVPSTVGAVPDSGIKTTVSDSPPSLSPTGNGVNTTVVWHTNVTDTDQSTTTVYNEGTVYALAGKTLAKIDATTGERLNQYHFSKSVRIETVAPNTVYVSADVNNAQKIQAIDADSFTVRWTTTLNDTSDSVASGEYFYTLISGVGGGTDNVVAINADTGNTTWERTFNDTIGTTEIADLRYETNVIFQGDPGIRGLDPASGTTLWSVPTRFEPFPLIDDGTVIGVTNSPPSATGDGPFAVGFDESDGSTVYEQQFSALFDPSRGGAQFITTKDGSYFADLNRSADSSQFIGFNSTAGTQLASVTYDQYLFAVAWSDTSSYIVMAGDNSFPILNTSTKSKAGSIAFDQSSARIYSLGVDIDGNTLYAGTQNGSVAAIELSPEQLTAPPAIVGSSQPTDPDGDGKYDDITGDGSVNILDVGALLANRNSDAVQNNPNAFDFTGDGSVNILDVGKLLQQVL